jgi:NADPH:quinone reductase-like Zn-dependent oxidoreductase
MVDLLKQQKIKPVIAQRFPLAEARLAHELLGKGGVDVLSANGNVILPFSTNRTVSGYTPIGPT